MAFSTDQLRRLTGMVLTMADSSLTQHVDAGLGAVTNCKADVYGPQVGCGVLGCLGTRQETRPLSHQFWFRLAGAQHCFVRKACMAAQQEKCVDRHLCVWYQA